ncbi:GNAT family N-acetyltransferase [Pyrococcus abyssi]|uniref:Acetyltransferase (GNAT) family protein n=1 Tax=Pyrococcus abyssi (strain GE5 / Orsay) TaxID=272844 RepID=Q9UZ38_PYRAB|nr:GNAT family N-acetyltransferase [Pyrococcus abyssi]CAB50221.1 Acetyltransferase (GNAT) family protein [Pyrococcus abyssi GE5]CCE70757.1 TPA: ribosomal protein S18 alanine acetyltransferase related [Pyrococcus abyssi GE5]
MIERIGNPIEVKDELLNLMFRIYRSTEGKYPALEWADEKPSLDDFPGFKKVYEPFLEFRLTKEFDELYVYKENNRIIGTVALVYKGIKEKGIWWVPEELINERTGLIELFVVDPEFQGKGIGSALLEFAIKRLNSLGKDAYVVTFPNIDAYRYYLKKGFKEVMRYKEFVILKA